MTTTDTLTAQRVAVTFPLRRPLTDLEPAIAVFHRCLQRGWLEGQLIDVADYRHVPHGPGVLVIGHDVDLGLTTDHLRLTRKRTAAPVDEQVRDLLRMAAVAAEVFAYDGTFEVDVDLGRATVELLDRAVAHDLGDDAGQLLADAVGDAFRTAWDDDAAALRAAGGLDPRAAPSALAEAGQTQPATEVLARLGGSRAPGQSPWDITVERFAELRQRDDVVVVDVREPSERETVHLDGTPIPLGELEDRLGELDPSVTTVVHCRAGIRSAKAVAILRAHGFADAWSVNGSLVAWADRIDPTTPRY